MPKLELQPVVLKCTILEKIHFNIYKIWLIQKLTRVISELRLYDFWFTWWIVYTK